MPGELYASIRALLIAAGNFAENWRAGQPLAAAMPAAGGLRHTWRLIYQMSPRFWNTAADEDADIGDTPGAWRSVRLAATRRARGATEGAPADLAMPPGLA